MNKYLLYILTSCLLFGLAACESEAPMEESHMQPLRIRAELPSSGFTRAIVGEDDGFSVRAFTNGDLAGFFSESNGAGTAFNNEKMTFQDGYFKGPAADINRLGKTLLYYPYSSGENGRQPIRNKETGEVIDLLYSTTVGNAEAVALVATFHHTFSMFIIDGGLGFKNINGTDNAGKPEITVTMAKPLETVEFQHSTDDVGYRVVFNGGYTEGVNPSEEYATFKGHYNDKDGKYYIILPNDGVTQVKSINVMDDGGRMHHIKWTQGWLAFGTKYPITLELDEDAPIINLHNITPWGGNTELQTEQEAGIGSVSAFKDWMETYNNNPKDEELQDYGNKIEIVNSDGSTSGEFYWHFMLSADIDFSKETVLNGASTLIMKLGDVLDGCGHTLSGISLAGEDAALIGCIEGEHAAVENLTVENLVLTTKGTSTPVGALATTFAQGSVKNCSFPNLKIDAQSAAGVIAGTLGSGVTIEHCKATGSIFAAGTVEKIIGSGTLTADQKKGCDVASVMFGQR